MSLKAPGFFFVLAALMAFAANARGDEQKTYSGPACAAVVDDFFANEVWVKVGARSCLECHKAGGDADESDFVLLDPELSQGGARDDAMRHNREQFVEMARLKQGDQSRLLLKATGRLRHRGKVVLKPDSAAYRVLAEFVSRLYAPPPEAVVWAAAAGNLPPFFDGVAMLGDRQLLRRITLSLAGRLPTDGEVAAVKNNGLKAIPELLDGIMSEEAFYARLREAFNDIFLTVGYDDLAENALSYEHFEKTRHWTEDYDLSSIADKDERQKARWKLADVYRQAVLGEPMKLVEYIVRNDRPFTEIVTADYIMVTPYTARGYGIYDELRPKFKNPDDPFRVRPGQAQGACRPEPSG